MSEWHWQWPSMCEGLNLIPTTEKRKGLKHGVCVWEGCHHKLGYQATSENVCPTAVLSMHGTQKEWE